MWQEVRWREPREIFEQWISSPGLVFFDSAAEGECGRYSFLALDPFEVVTAPQAGDPFAFLQARLQTFPMDTIPDLPPFQGGAAGFFSYELHKAIEGGALARDDDMGFPVMAIGLFDLVVAFDHLQRRAWIISSGYPQQVPAAREQRAATRLASLLSRWEESGSPYPRSGKTCPASEVVCHFTRDTYEQAIRQVQAYIRAGDIFQANLTRRFHAPLPAGLAPGELYLILRERNPAPFAAYVSLLDTHLVSASPERFMKVSEKGVVETRPIKGTRPRGKTAAADRALSDALLASAKDRAENVMIVDLLRNDLSRVCQPHSVRVPALCSLESHAAVHHLVSVVTGQLQPSQTALDALRAAFPGGSVTGAPKIRAMEIIADLEPVVRGPYCGSIGYVGFDGSMDTSITIRTFAIRKGQVTFQAGGAIVLDSDPAAEFDETSDKVRPLWEALTGQALT